MGIVDYYCKDVEINEMAEARPPHVTCWNTGNSATYFCLYRSQQSKACVVPISLPKN